MSYPWEWSNEHNQYFARTADGRYIWQSAYEKLQQANAQTAVEVDPEEPEETTHFRQESDYNSLNPSFFQHPSPVRNPHSQLVGHAQTGYQQARGPFVRSDSAPAAQTTDTYTPREIPERFAWDVVIPWETDRKVNKIKYAVALLDTQSQNGNWITWELLKKINKAQFVHKKEGAVVETAIGLMRSIGTITIQMRRLEGNQFFKVLFNVGPSQKAQGYEMLFGRDFLNKNDIIRVNRDALLPNLVADGLTPAQQAAMAALEEHRRLERESLAANGR